VPDAVVSSANCYTVIEAERLKSRTFQPGQLAREYVALTRDAGPRTPLAHMVADQQARYLRTVMGSKLESSLASGSAANGSAEALRK
jgi:hypothetical protein